MVLRRGKEQISNSLPNTQKRTPTTGNHRKELRTTVPEANLPAFQVPARSGTENWKGGRKGKWKVKWRRVRVGSMLHSVMFSVLAFVF